MRLGTGYRREDDVPVRTGNAAVKSPHWTTYRTADFRDCDRHIPGREA